MLNNKEIKAIAWKQVTTHFKKSFLLSLIPIVFMVIGVGANRPNNINISTTDSSFDASINMDTSHFFQNNWLIILIAVFIGILITIVVSSALSAIQDMFTESSVSGFMDWQESNSEPESPIKAGFKLLTSMNFKISFLRSIYTLLWSLLFFVPGIVKSFSYSQAVYIYRDDLRAGRDIKSANDYITASRKLMNNNKGQLFVLYLSLIGWFLLSFITLGIAGLFVLPYTLSISASFYIALRDTPNSLNEKSVL